jgi:CDP-diacylglycerol--glycerol-3-phosphate 3-phosphatidyltransferase
VPSAGRPLITANQVTLARLVPMPLLSWLLYRGAEHGFKDNAYMWSALIAGTLIGCTDWIDGLLARKYGPTVLGGLLDPIADKIFIAFAYTPFVNCTGALLPWWAVALMFQREFFVTALRSAYEQRNLTLKTSYLAKVKTWTQMQGIGVVLLFPLVENQSFLTWLLIAGVASPLVAMVALWIIRKKLWRGAFVMSGSFVPILSFYLYGGTKLVIPAIMVMIVAITWISGLDYILVGWKQLRGRGDFARADGVRIIGALALPLLAYATLSSKAVLGEPAASWPIFVILAFELAVGGLDNLMSHHKRATKALAWGGRVLGICVLLGAALIVPAYALPLAILAAAVSVVGVFAEFWRGRDYFLDKRIRDKALREAAAQG